MRKATVRRAAIIALIVGTILNLINQGDALLSGSEINGVKALLTYCVPFIVSLVSSWLTQREITQGNE
ncbi:nitrate/nitrite transporter NrtS [Vibrio atypicus]|uniref:nitrate/nitrite transporter NrtS n=1 Tax=Vibrio atypicus TaxID=558271 RepID=UPI001357EFF9|nr:nitrate/nitrite transporter NrtS [Vibrio atypicus]